MSFKFDGFSTFYECIKFDADFLRMHQVLGLKSPKGDALKVLNWI